MSVSAVLENLRTALDSVGIPYMVTGSLVSSVHGVPRATQDIDVVIEPTREQLSALMEYRHVERWVRALEIEHQWQAAQRAAR